MTAGPFSADSFSARREALDMSIAVNKHNLDNQVGVAKDAAAIVADADVFLGFLLPSTQVSVTT